VHEPLEISTVLLLTLHCWSTAPLLVLLLVIRAVSPLLLLLIASPAKPGSSSSPATAPLSVWPMMAIGHLLPLFFLC
jgi:hypothetical protein